MVKILPALFKFGFSHWPTYKWGYVAAYSLREALDYLAKPRNEGDGKPIIPQVRFIEEIGHVENVWVDGKLREGAA